MALIIPKKRKKKKNSDSTVPLHSPTRTIQSVFLAIQIIQGAIQRQK